MAMLIPSWAVLGGLGCNLGCLGRCWSLNWLVWLLNRLLWLLRWLVWLLQRGGGDATHPKSWRRMGLGVPKKEALKKKASALKLQVTALTFEVEALSLKLEELFAMFACSYRNGSLVCL